MNKKKTLLALFSAAVAFSLTACGDVGDIVDSLLGDNSTTSETTETTESTESTDTTDSTDSTDQIATYSILIGETGGATITLSAETAAAGTQIDITISDVPEGYEVAGVTIDVDGVTAIQTGTNTYYFIMPASDVTVGCTLTQTVQSTYTLTINNNADGTPSIMTSGQDLLSAEADGTYSLSPNASYYLLYAFGEDDYTVTFNGTLLTGASLTTSSDYYTFTMPTQDSVIDIDVLEEGTTIEGYYSLSIDYDATAFEEFMVLDPNTGMNHNLSSIQAGATVVIGYTLKTGYTIESFTLNNSEIEFGTWETSFAMPAQNSTVVITTSGSGSSEVIGYSLTLDYTADAFSFIGVYDSESSAVEDTSSIAAGTYLIVGWELNSGYSIDSVTINGTATDYGDEGFDFEMPARNTTIVIATSSTNSDGPFTITLKYLDLKPSGSYYEVQTSGLDYIADYTAFEGGETYVLVAWASNTLANCGVDAVYLNGKELTGGNAYGEYTFTMPYEDVEIEVVWTDHYTFEFDKDTAPSGTAFYVYTDAEGWYTVQTANFYGKEGDVFYLDVYCRGYTNGVTLKAYANGEELSTEGSLDCFKLTLPKANVTITFTY